MSFSRVESERFKKSVHRFHFDEIDHEAVRAIRKARPDIAIVRFPSEKIDQLANLELYGVSPLVADTLGYYECDLESYEIPGRRNEDLECRPASVDDRGMLSELVGQVFAGYKNHYASNPLLSRSDILDGYVEWGLSYLEELEHHTCWILQDGERPVAFANCRQEGECFEGVLYGVDRAYSGRGIYGDLVTLTQHEAVSRGCTRMIVSTQIQNLAVQRAWVRRGFRLSRSLNTVHLNLLMSDDYCLAAHEERIRLDDSLVSKFGRLVGDENPVSFDDAAAARQGLDGRIAHGALLNGLVSKLLGMQLPGNGTIYLSQGASYLKPAYLNRAVTVKILIKHVDRETGRITASTRVYDEGGDLVFAGVAELLNESFAMGL
jgi:acyl dehydratase